MTEIVDPREAFLTTSPHFGAMVSPAADIRRRDYSPPVPPPPDSIDQADIRTAEGRMGEAEDMTGDYVGCLARKKPR